MTYTSTSTSASPNVIITTSGGSITTIKGFPISTTTTATYYPAHPVHHPEDGDVYIQRNKRYRFNGMNWEDYPPSTKELMNEYK